MIVCSPELFQGQHVKDMVVSPTENVDPRKFRQEERKTWPHSFYYWRDFRDSYMADCAVLLEMNLTAREMLRHRALNSRRNELGKQERRDREGVANKKESLENHLRAAKEATARLEKVVQSYEATQGTKSKAAER